MRCKNKCGGRRRVGRSAAGVPARVSDRNRTENHYGNEKFKLLCAAAAAASDHFLWHDDDLLCCLSLGRST
jgi:hypothetical protein